MELQLFDSGGQFCFRVNALEPLWSVLQSGLRHAAVAEAGETIERDVSLDGPELHALKDHVAAELRDRVSSLPELETAGYYDAATITVFGEPLAIRVRNPRHQELQRINGLHECLDRIASSGHGAQVFFVPDLTTVDHVVVGVLTATGDGLERGLLAQQVRDRIRSFRSANGDDSPGSQVSGSEELLDDAVINGRVERLASAGLIEHRTDGTVSASGKARTILR
jgi:hypothetical protein